MSFGDYGHNAEANTSDDETICASNTNHGRHGQPSPTAAAAESPHDNDDAEQWMKKLVLLLGTNSLIFHCRRDFTGYSQGNRLTVRH